MLQTGGQSSGYNSCSINRSNEKQSDASKPTDSEATDNSTQATPRGSRNKKMKHSPVTQSRKNLKKAIDDFSEEVIHYLAYVLSHTTRLVINLILLKLLTEKIENSFFSVKIHVRQNMKKN